MLVRREHSAAELKRKLAARGVADEAAGGAVGALARSGLQSDARYAELLVRSRVSQGFGPQRIAADLEAAGVSPADAGAALAAAGVDWLALAIGMHARKFRQAPASAAEWQKQYRFLAGRGFEPRDIYAALKSEPP